MSARGEPSDIMYSNVIDRLDRVRQLYKLKLELADVIMPVLPSELFAASFHTEWSQLCKAIRFEHWSTFGIDGDAFWIRGDSNSQWPCPSSNEVGFDIPVSHPHYDELRGWVNTVKQIDDFLEDAKVYLNRTFRTLKHPKWVERYWPKIIPYTAAERIPEIMLNRMREPRPSAIHLDEDLQQRIEEELAKASLLGSDYSVNAWVGSGVELWR